MRLHTFAIALLMLLVPGVVAHAGNDDLYLLHLPGIGGERVTDHWLIGGLKAGGVKGEIAIDDWTQGDFGLPALQSYALNRARAKAISARLADHIRRHPHQRVVLTSHSGGVGLAVWALEDLPAHMQIDTLVMLQPALSPEYDLSAALRHVKGKAYSFSSNMDTIVLKAGTELFGTIDGVRTEAAGLNGFVRPPTGDKQQYAKLVSVRYQSDWLVRYGNAGSHICCMRPTFAREFIAPIILTGKIPGPTTRPVAQAGK